tara:strand:+ start:334 stop:588 length:255 start_codon:yes stop_codon:yes gene_type:complete
MKNWIDYSFVVRSKHRKRVFEALKEPKTPSQLSKELDLQLGYISNILATLLNGKLIECLNQNEKRYRLYIRTKKGNNILKLFKK